jgi:uncharacterized iron-regulated membrane protein
MYERQLIEWSDRGFRSTPTPGVERAPIESLIARAQQLTTNAPTAVTIRSDATAPVAVAFGSVTFYMDAYSGQILGQPATGIRTAMTTLRSWHRWLAVEGEHRTTTKAITGWSNFIFLCLVLSGMYLWIPRAREWTRVRAVMFFKGGLRGRARDFNWHNTIGIWCAVPLAIVVVTAMPISFPWANTLLFRLVGETPPPPASPAGGAAPASQGIQATAREAIAATPANIGTHRLNELMARAEVQVPGWRSITVRIPASSARTLPFTIDRGNGGQPQARGTLTLDASGTVVRWEPFESQSSGRRLRSWARFTHTGEAFGLTGQTVAGIVSGGAVLLVWTGLSLALRRFLGWMSRRRRPESNHTAPAQSEAA